MQALTDSARPLTPSLHTLLPGPLCEQPQSHGPATVVEATLKLQAKSHLSPLKLTKPGNLGTAAQKQLPLATGHPLLPLECIAVVSHFCLSSPSYR